MGLLGNMRYLKCARTPFVPSHSWDIFISAFNGASRVTDVFAAVDSSEKRWVILPEYGYGKEVETLGLESAVVVDETLDEAGVAESLFEGFNLSDASLRICIDITGFMRPHILAVVAKLRRMGVRRYDVIYTEPAQYKRKENTAFVGCDVDVVRPVIDYEGVHSDDVSGDVLIVGVGYDDSLVSRVVNDKDSARLVQLLSLPSLSADMYQESLLRLDRADLYNAGDHGDHLFFSPANDPFVIADELSSKIRSLFARSQFTNLYLSPLATKVQALGFGLYYQAELVGTASSILFPFTRKYERETSLGVGRSWVYKVET